MACQYLAILVAFALLGQGSARDMLTVKGVLAYWRLPNNAFLRRLPML